MNAKKDMKKQTVGSFAGQIQDKSAQKTAQEACKKRQFCEQ